MPWAELSQSQKNLPIREKFMPKKTLEFIEVLKFSKTLILTSCISVILFCSCATAYQANGLTGGYSDFRIARNTFVVSFQGNGFTPSETVLKYALKRASELTIQNGFSYFSIEGGQDTTQRMLVANGFSDSQTNLYSYSNTASLQGTTSSSASVSEIIKPSVTINIRCYKSKPTGIETINAEEYLNFNP